MDIFHSVEFYVIILLIAALAIAFISRPSEYGPVYTSFANGRLRFLTDIEDPTPRIELECLDDGSVKITRYGLPDNLTDDSTVALAITRKGFDISIEERITAASGHGSVSSTTSAVSPDAVAAATFILPDLAQERYHIRYNSDPTSSFTSFTLSNRPGLHSVRPFNHD